LVESTWLPFLGRLFQRCAVVELAKLRVGQGLVVKPCACQVDQDALCGFERVVSLNARGQRLGGVGVDIGPRAEFFVGGGLHGA
jgi:hypothetical protein